MDESSSEPRFDGTAFLKSLKTLEIDPRSLQSIRLNLVRVTGAIRTALQLIRYINNGKSEDQNTRNKTENDLWKMTIVELIGTLYNGDAFRLPPHQFLDAYPNARGYVHGKMRRVEQYDLDDASREIVNVPIGGLVLHHLRNGLNVLLYNIPRIPFDVESFMTEPIKNVVLFTRDALSVIHERKKREPK